MQNPSISLVGILSALGLDTACLSLLEKTAEYSTISNVRSPGEVYAAIRQIGKLLDAETAADELAENLEERINIIEHKLKFIADEHKPKVLCLSDISPVIVAQSPYLDKLIRIAGGIEYARWEDGEFDPDIIILINSKPMSQLLSELPNMLATTYWSETNAVKNNNIFVVHDPLCLQEPGAHIADDAEILAEIINPKYFIFGKNGKSWMQFDIS